MYDCVDKHNGPCLLVIQTTDEEVSIVTDARIETERKTLSNVQIFGAYISEPLHVSSRYYGSGEW